MRNFYRSIVLSSLLYACNASAWTVFLDAIDWRATETNDWCYNNSLQLPNQTIGYHTINFDYTPGFRLGGIYENPEWDSLLSYTRLYTTAYDSASGNLRPAFSGSVTASPTGYLFQSGKVSQAIDYNIFDLNVGRPFHPSESLMLHPTIGVMGGWINQQITADFKGSTSTHETISNNFNGIGPKAGVDADIVMFNYHDYQPELTAGFAASYLIGHWHISDYTKAYPVKNVYVNGVSHRLGALTLQATMGIKLNYKNFSAKLAYEISDWFNQSQFFDNDTGTHNNDLILQGLTLGISC